MKTLPALDRTLFLRKTLEEYNKWVLENVRVKVDTITTQSKYNFNGVILPFETGDDLDPSVIMKIVPDLAVPFETKKRSPFKVVFETVKLSELRNGLFQQATAQEDEKEEGGAKSQDEQSPT